MCKMERLNVWIIFVLSLFISAVCADLLIVNTKNGKVKGSTVTTAVGGEVDAWYSIPYAKPPVGDLRFRHPHPVDRWNGVKDVTALPNACFQVLDTFFEDFEGTAMWNPKTMLSEDCLYLSVVAPKPRKMNVPVVVWIHGGGFYSGASALDIYDYRTLSELQNVVVVGLNYRLGSLGFMYMDTDDIPGNSGMFDQVLALQWIKNNIERFGGNPDNITLMGESAGAASVSMHLLSPQSRNLFNQAIMQSSSSTAPSSLFSNERNKRRTEILAERVGCSSDNKDVGDCLRKVNATDLVHNAYFTDDDLGALNPPFTPIVDGSFLTEKPIESLRKGNFKKANILTGSNSEEGNWFLLYFLTELYNLHQKVPITHSDFVQSVPKLFPHLSEQTVKSIIFQYTDWLEPNNTDKNRDGLDKMVGDYLFHCDVYEFANYYVDYENSVYMYYFKHVSSGNKFPEWMGALHGDEISYLFGQPLNPNLNFTQAERNLSRKMMDYWGNFIKFGNPEGENPESNTLGRWPQYSDNKEYLNFARNEHTISRGNRDNYCAFWKSLVPSLEDQCPDVEAQCPDVEAQCPDVEASAPSEVTTEAPVRIPARAIDAMEPLAPN